MFLEHFYTETDSIIQISAQQASDFAKTIAGDFNPIHCPDNKRFCVPGDLLFSLVLAKYGVSNQMSFNFSGMVGRDVPLLFPTQVSEQFSICDSKHKCYLEVSHSGQQAQSTQLIEQIIRQYVAFSGHNFPHILVPLVKAENVMIHPTRPLVIYDSMNLQFDTLDLNDIQLVQTHTDFVVDGKRGDATLYFDILEDGKIVGNGSKKLILSGLMPYDAPKIQGLIDDYEARKAAYTPLTIA